uniref:DNA helicase Pif1-like 2B domain-containing protein n=1 Tax=Tanacetum cinerariifolium TaxID=118510 RepID=A0A6L2KDL8_TANCI|nr:hypothetical protein [Tanacetum cinerariifolium]
MPPHALHLKKELLIMLLRNVNPTQGLCNENQLIITDLGHLDHCCCSFLFTSPPDSLWQILLPNTLETIIQSSSNIIKHPITEFVQFINPHQPVLLVFILIDESSWIGVSGVSFLAFQIETAPQEPILFNLKPCKNSSQSPPQIDHQCCYECGDPLDGVFCRRCTYESCGNGANIGYNCPPKVPVVSNLKPYHNQNVDELPQTLTNFHPTSYIGDENSSAHDSTPNFVNDSPNVFHPPPQTMINSYGFCGNDAYYSYDCPPQVPHNDDNDENYTIPITPKEPDNSLSMGDEHLDTILATESDKVIKPSVEDLIPIPSEYEGIPNSTCDVPFHNNSPPLDVSEDQFEEFYDSNDDSTSIYDDYFSIDNIDYIELSPLDSELFSLEEVKDNNLREKLMNINLLIAKIKSLNDNPTPDHGLKSPIPVEDINSFLEKSDTSLSYSDNSLPEFETFSNHTEETNSDSTTTHADYSLSKYDSFLF